MGRSLMRTCNMSTLLAVVVIFSAIIVHTKAQTACPGFGFTEDDVAKMKADPFKFSYEILKSGQNDGDSCDESINWVDEHLMPAADQVSKGKGSLDDLCAHMKMVKDGVLTKTTCIRTERKKLACENGVCKKQEGSEEDKEENTTSQPEPKPEPEPQGKQEDKSVDKGSGTGGRSFWNWELMTLTVAFAVSNIFSQPFC